nr:transmembrane prolyl 4-hydroxylase-like [Lytechinus pictus]
MELNVGLLLAVFSWIFFINNYVLSCDDGCATEGQNYIPIEEVPERMVLFQYHPIKVGHVRYIEIEPGRYVQMKTLAMHPPIFEIPKFLTHEETTYIKRVASESGLETSRTAFKGSLTNNNGDSLMSHAHLHGYNETFWKDKLSICDTDNDLLLDQAEALRCLPDLRRQNVSEAMLDLMMGDLQLDYDSDARFDAKELWRVSEVPSVAEDIRTWLERWRREGEEGRMVKKWKGRTRVSDQTWISSNTQRGHPLQNIQQRIVALTRLSPEIVQTSESMQVVRYRPGGHYHAHFDSSEVTSDLECRHTGITFNQSREAPFHEERCRYCRMITILYYLNDVDEGGETAFPFADMDINTPEYERKLEYDYTDLTDHCHDSSLVVKAERGKAIMWYNHNLDPQTGWLGTSRGHSLHGGCEVIRGVKWIANNWISVDDVYNRQQRYMDELRPFIRATSLNSNPRKSTTKRAGLSQDKSKHSPKLEKNTNNSSCNSRKDAYKQDPIEPICSQSMFDER